ncbi:MAG TPA: type II toxin-antitoxin system HipA family toxin [Verrucomicrobiae bacterium]|jgi:serine/threonine-protein kinase HipA|nr:type II toxin-antitoxin system HipA family toxin [Verrucomicrobiae bacterium]
MPRKRQHIPLLVLLNNRPVGQLQKEPGGTISFRYDEKWLSGENAIPVSLSLPLREDAYRGAVVAAVFDNLLPDSDALRQRVAERVGAGGTDAYSLLSQIGRDCVGALQFIPEGSAANKPASGIGGKAVGEREIEALLVNLVRTPLGLDREQDFRISIAGAQEKTALLRSDGKWLKPRGTTPTTHILKTQIGTLPNGMDLSNSVENEYYCLKLLGAFGLPVNSAEITTFGKTKALVIERFDRKWIGNDHILRLPQEDFCQALSCPPTRKYQGEGGPGMVDILEFLKAADAPAEDQKTFLKAQILFWLLAATDGHAKNFSIFLGPQGRFRLTPLYDVLSAQPSLDTRQIERKQMKLAMSVGRSRHYRIEEIQGRHFVQTVEAAGLPGARATDALREVVEAAPGAMKTIEKALPRGFPKKIHTSITSGLGNRLKRIEI